MLKLEEKYTKLSEVTCCDLGGLVSEWPHHENIVNAVLHWKPNEQKGYDATGFYFCATQWVAGEDEDPDQYVEILLTGYAFFDGIRHIWFCRDKDADFHGYENYPELETWIALLTRLREIEKQNCFDV